MSDDNIISLTHSRQKPAEVNAMAVERATDLLEVAKDGTLSGFIAIGETPDGLLYESSTQLHDLPLLLTGLEIAKARILAALLEYSDD